MSFLYTDLEYMNINIHQIKKCTKLILNQELLTNVIIFIQQKVKTNRKWLSIESKIF